MEKIKVVHNQNLLDICLQEYGNLDALLPLAFANGLSISDTVPAGSFLTIPEILAKNTEILEFYANKEVVPASALDDAVLDILDNRDDCDLCQYFE